MQIHAIELNHVRGIEHLRVDQLPKTGVIVIHGDNEAGKSTILEAIDVVLREKHRARNKNTRPLQTVGSSEGPEVTLDLTVGPHRMTVRKRFIAKPLSELTITTPRREQLTGSEADDRLEQILEEYLDKELVSTLFLRQDDLNDAVAAVGVPSLTQALNAQAGADALAPDQAAEDTALMADIEREYSRYFTHKKGEPTKDYARLIAEVDKAEARVRSAQTTLDEQEQFVVDHERAVEDIASAQAQLPVAKSELEANTEAARVAAQATQQLEAARELLQRAEMDTARAREDLAHREELAASATAAAQALDELKQSLAPAQKAAETERAERERLSSELSAAKSALDTARTEVKRARLASEHEAETAAFQVLGKRLTELDAAEADLTAAEQAVAESGKEVTAAHVQEVEDAAAEVAVARRVHALQSAALIFSTTEAQDIEVDGQPQQLDPGEDTTVELRDGTAVTIGSVTARFRAGAGTDASTADALEGAQRTLTELLEAHGCTDVDELRARREHQRELATELSAAKTAVATVLAGESASGLRAKAQALGAKLAEFEQPADEDVPPLTIAEADAAEDTARQAVERLEAALAPWLDGQAGTELIKVETQLASAQARAAEAVSAHEKAQADLPDADLSARLEQAIAQQEQHQRAVAEAEAKQRAADPETAAKLAQGSQTLVESLQETIRTAEIRKARREGDIARHEGAAEALDRATAEHEQLRVQLDSMQRRAEAAAYLREVFHRHREAARSRYAQPFARRLEQLARRVYGHDVTFELSDALEVTARTHSGQTIALDSLSGGAKEQLAILTRFAIADLIREDAATAGVPVVVDDALGSTDDNRLRLMATLFSDVGEHSQVIVFTCMPQRYSRVVGRTDLDIAQLKEQ